MCGCFPCFSNGFTDKRATIPNFNLVNQSSLDKILKVELFIHTDGQLRAAHLILDHILISFSFQALKCQIKARDPRLHLINVPMPGFLNPGSRPQGVLKIESLLQCKAEDEATPFQPATREEEEEEKEEEVVEVFDSKDEFEVFNQPQSPEVSTDDFSHLPSAEVSQIQEDSFFLEAIGIKRKQMIGLLDVMKSSIGSKAPEKTIQAKLPPSPPTQLLRPDPADHKRKKD